jgi:putative PIN family toxin of toxin-antitoxin system
MPPSAAVLDASVLISGFLTEGPPRMLLNLAEPGRFRMILSAVILEETRRTLGKPKLLRAYRHSTEAIRDYCEGLAAAARLVEVERAFVSPCRDPNDHHVVATAVAAGIEVIVTGDKDLLDLGRYAGIRILAPRRFIEELAER